MENKLQQILSKFEEKKETYNQELQELQVRKGVLVQNLEQMKENIIAQFGTDDPVQLQEILMEKENELNSLIQEMEMTLEQV